MWLAYTLDYEVCIYYNFFLSPITVFLQHPSAVDTVQNIPYAICLIEDWLEGGCSREKKAGEGEGTHTHTQSVQSIN